MAITIVSGNLNQFGNAGQFESDRSTWGFANSSYTVTRSSLQKATGLCSAHVVKSATSNSLILPCRYPSALGKRYFIKAKVRVPSSAPIAADAVKLTFKTSLDNLLLGGTVLGLVEKTVLQAKDTWVDVEAYIQHTSTLFPSLNETVHLRVDGSAILNGQVFVDQFEVYEYTGTPETEGDPPPDGVVQFANNSFTTVMAPWENIVSGSAAPFEWLSGNSVIADGTVTNRYRSDYLSGITDNAGPWPPGDYVVEIIAENLSESGLPRHEEIVKLAGFSSLDASPTVISSGLSAPFDRVAGDQTRYLTFTLTQYWLYLGFRFEQNGFGSGSKLKMTVKSITVLEGPESGETEEPVVTDAIFLSKNPIILGASAQAGWEGLTNYRVYNEVRVEDVADSNVFNTKFQTDLYPASNGLVTFYLNEAFRDCFRFIPPELNESSIIRLTDRIKRFKNYQGELQDTDVIPGTLSPGEVNLVLFGGVDKYHYPGLKYLSEYLPTNKKFLTWAPIHKHVDRLQEDYLNFFVYSNTIGDLQLQIKAYFDDGTDETNITATIESVLYRGLYQIPAGPANSGVMSIDEEKNVVRYELTLLNQDDEAVSETRTYYIESVRHPLTRFFMFLNSLGSFEVLRFTGQSIDETEFSRDVVQRFLPHNYEALDGEFAINSTIMAVKKSYSSGHIKGRMAALWHEYMKEFMMSTRIYDVTNGDRKPVVISGGTHVREDQNYKRYIRFETKSAYDDTSFTPSEL